MTRWKTFTAAFLMSLTGVSVSAGALLTVEAPSGEITFDMEGLRGLPVATFETETIWTDGTQRFTGVSLADLIAHLGIDTGTLEAMAINAYAVDIPVSDAVAGGPVIAYERNGAIMSVRDKGPLWIVYPYDSNPNYRTEEIYSRSIWQLEKVTVKP